LTELVAYKQLGVAKAEGLATGLVNAGVAERAPLSARTQVIASFALCGFANLGSMAIQIGGLGAMAPERSRDLAALAMRAMLVGALTTCLTASLAGVLARV
jgi:CNT family concentrative nucleoside transporter